ncbi:hypothetical protein [Pseudaquabacterium rugosum]|uniref:ATPase AAA-type core domain-containing protein n=1 Tax=Pseudaquabacterium rugosum TaxID=2984194 RepID=A0ABU9BJX1_9BURK
MTLLNLSYAEFENEPRFWRLNLLDFGPSNLVVGKNATGKSRLISVITGLMGIISGARPNALDSGTYSAEFLIEEKRYVYEISFKQKIVQHERLSVDGTDRLTRNETGQGSIYYSKEDRYLEFAVPTGTIALQAKKDQLQHPFIVDISNWASSSATYIFGSDFGRSRLHVAAQQTSVIEELQASSNKEDPDDAVGTYIAGYKHFGDAFDRAIIEDMGKLGYALREVAVEPLDPGIAMAPHGAPLLSLVVVERDLSPRIPQIFLSQGMFRALALTIKLNWSTFSGRKGLILIDDLGEGLDYERACAAVEIAMQKAASGACQIIMTSNDRFVMNSVSLDHWIVLQRNGPEVKGYTSRNSPNEFESFRFTGLSNFDFFTSGGFH